MEASGGPHLHLEATKLNQNGVRGFVDPLKLGGTWYPGSDFWGYYEREIDGEFIFDQTKPSWESTWPR